MGSVAPTPRPTPFPTPPHIPYPRAAHCLPFCVPQLAYYRMENRFVPTYEPAMMRFFCEGRTETIRSCSEQSCAFVRAMDDPSGPARDPQPPFLFCLSPWRAPSAFSLRRRTRVPGPRSISSNGLRGHCAVRFTRRIDLRRWRPMQPIFRQKGVRRGATVSHATAIQRCPRGPTHVGPVSLCGSSWPPERNRAFVERTGVCRLKHVQSNCRGLALLPAPHPLGCTRQKWPPSHSSSRR